MHTDIFLQKIELWNFSKNKYSLATSRKWQFLGSAQKRNTHRMEKRFEQDLKQHKKDCYRWNSATKVR